MPPSTDFESLFHAAIIDLLVPSLSACPPQPENEKEAGPSSLRSWWAGVQDAKARDVAFFDEKLVYYVGMRIPNEGPSSAGDEVPPELLRFLSRLQLHMTASFLPPLAPSASTPQTFGHAQASTTGLAPPSASDHRTPTPQGNPGQEGAFLPVTPNPHPGMKGGEDHYAQIEGQVVWEAEVVDEWKVIKSDDGSWDVVWKGEVPVAYARTQIQNPLLGLTASITLREGAAHTRTHRKSAMSIDASLIRTGLETLQLEDRVEDADEEDLAGMEEIDLLGGLVGDSDTMPGSRLGPSIRQDLSIADPIPGSAIPASARTPKASHIATPDGTPTAGFLPTRERQAAHPVLPMIPATSTLRKSFRRVMALSPGLRVRMRTLFLPQLVPLTDDQNLGHDGDVESEKKIALCVEVENPLDGGGIGASFEVERVTVEVGGKGGKATAELLCQPEQKAGSTTGVFPLRLRAVEQYNLLYVVSIASAPDDRNAGVDEAVARNLGRVDEQRPAAITIIGRPFVQSESVTERETSSGTEQEYPTDTFSSRWNCTIDLTAYYASLTSTSTSAQPLPGNRHRQPKATVPPPNPVAGDKRYSLATLLSESPGNSNTQPRDPRRPAPRAILPSQNLAANNRLSSLRAHPTQSHEGLLISVKLLSQSTSSANASAGTVRPFEAFSIEVFVHNRTEEVRRFRLSVPPRDVGGGEKVAELLEQSQKRRRGAAMKQDDPVLRQILAGHLASAPALIPLENDIRCGPLLPGASLSARLRFMALREGVHKLEKLRVTGMGDDWDFVMSPVLDVIVGEGD